MTIVPENILVNIVINFVILCNFCVTTQSFPILNSKILFGYFDIFFPWQNAGFKEILNLVVFE